jgi:Amt family ammonium transporter
MSSPALVATPADLSSQISSINDTVNALTLGTIPGYSDVNAAWTLTSGYLVFFMQAGFAMLCAGSVRAKNAKNIILLNILDACLGSVMWWCLGWAFAFGDPAPNADGTYPWYGPFIGHRYFFQNQLPRTSYVSWFFQFTFAATGATIVSGAVAERCKFVAYLLYNSLIVGLVYPVVAHWVWSPFGWMSALRTPETSNNGYVLFSNSGVYDFAGDGPVHMVGGFASLAGAWVLGPRIGRFDADGKPVDMPGHNASLTLLGVFFLWFGWYGFNPGSTNAVLGSFVGYSQISAAIAINTTIAAATGALSTLVIVMLDQYFRYGVITWDLVMCGNGALAGLVAITGPCAFVQTWAAVLIGVIGGGVYVGSSKFVLHVLKIDDPVDAIAVHAFCGAWGIIGSAAFADLGMVTDYYGPYPGTSQTNREYGFIMGDRGGKLLGAHVVYIICIAAWVLGVMTPFFMILKKLGLFRVSPEVEAAGLDISHHGGPAYPHDPTEGKVHNYHAAASDYPVSADMVRRLVDESIDSLRHELKGLDTPPTHEDVVNGNSKAE